MKKLFILFFCIVTSCVNNKERLNVLDFDEKRIKGLAIKEKNVVVDKGYIYLYIDNKNIFTAKCLLNINKRQGVVISILPVGGYEAYRIFLDGHLLKIVNRERKNVYEINLFKLYKIKRGMFNDLYFDIILNNYNKKFKSFTYITDNNSRYSEWIEKIGDKGSVYVYIDRRYYKIKEIFYRSENFDLQIKYNTCKNSSFSNNYEIDFMVNKSDYHINIKLEIHNMVVRIENKDIYLIPESYNRIENGDLYEVFKEL